VSTDAPRGLDAIVILFSDPELENIFAHLLIYFVLTHIRRISRYVRCPVVKFESLLNLRRLGC
jgi:hypothetical protein